MLLKTGRVSSKHVLMMTLFLYDYVFPIVKRGWQAKCKQSDVTIQVSDWLLRMPFDWLLTKFASVIQTKYQGRRKHLKSGGRGASPKGAHYHAHFGLQRGTFA